MENNTLKTLLDKDYASKIKELVQLLINDDEPAKAFRLRETLSRAVDENVLKFSVEYVGKYRYNLVF